MELAKPGRADSEAFGHVDGPVNLTISLKEMLESTWYAEGLGQATRVRGLLTRYVEAGILEQDDRIAACPLYRHRDGLTGALDRQALKHFEAHAWYRWSANHETYLRLILHDLDRLVPRDVDPSRFTASGAVLPGRLESKPAPRRQEPVRPTLMGVYV